MKLIESPDNVMQNQNSETPQIKVLTIYIGIAAGIGVGVPFLINFIFNYHNSNILKLFLNTLFIFLAFSGLIWRMITATGTKAKQRVDLFSPYIFFPVIFVILYGLGTIPLIDSERQIPLSQYAFYFIGLIAYFAGILTVRILRVKPIEDLPFRTKWKLSRLKNVMIILMLIFFFCLMYVLMKTRLPIFQGANIEELRIEFFPAISGYVYYLFRTIEIVLILFFVYVFSRQKSILTSPWKLAFFLFSLFFLFIFAARRVIAVPLLTGILIYHYARRRISLAKLTVVGLIFFLIFILMGYFRYTGSLQISEEFLSSRIYHEISINSLVLHKTVEVFPQQEEFLGWKGFIQPFKSILPGRQKSIGDILKEDIMELEFRGGGFMPSILGGFYLNFGFWGVIIGMFLSGFILNALYSNMLQKKNEFRVVLYSYVTVYFVSCIRAMVLAELWPIYVVFVLLITNYYCKRKNNIDRKKLITSDF